MKPTLFFDMDGVLCDFVGGALKAHNRADVSQSVITWGIEAQLGIDPPAFWAPLGYEFWRDLQPYPDGFELLGYATQMVGIESIGLLTSPCDTAGCVDGKRAWVAKHLPDYRRRLFVGSAKDLFAGPTKILIDDHDPNCTKFQAAGGFAVQPPRPWNPGAPRCVNGHRFDVDAVIGDLETVMRVATRTAA